MFFQKMDDYQKALMYCIRNDIENAYFHLNRAANAGHKIAMSALKELEDKNLLHECKSGRENAN
ncbi:MAG: hypothetical protein JO131_02135 [Gammaproteobacteria bacterium]|nr:hypothetical protein [Gammaproteobacteria bacterium]